MHARREARTGCRIRNSIDYRILLCSNRIPDGYDAYATKAPHNIEFRRRSHTVEVPRVPYVSAYEIQMLDRAIPLSAAFQKYRIILQHLIVRSLSMIFKEIMNGNSQSDLECSTRPAQRVTRTFVCEPDGFEPVDANGRRD